MTSRPAGNRGGTSSANSDGTFNNPVIYADVPDPDVIRVNDVYYMVSTTMHMAPGAPIMKSFDLINWEMINYAYDELEDSDRFILNDGKNDYANGSWAASIRHDPYQGRFYVAFTCESTNKSYLFSTDQIEGGKWHRTDIDAVKCYDNSLLFIDNGVFCEKYIMYVKHRRENDLRWTSCCIRKLSVDESNWDIALEPVETVLIEQTNCEFPIQGLNAEGYHAYKFGDYYYIFMIQGVKWQRQEIVWRKAELTPGNWEVRKIFTGNIVDETGNDYLPFTGVAQGGIVQTLNGEWYSMLFEDYGAVGRIPVLIPMVWRDGWPVLGNGGLSVNNRYPMPVQGYPPASIVASDEFNEPGLKLEWQWNHNPDNQLWSLTDRAGHLRLKSGVLSRNIQEARNTLTQRSYGPTSSADTVMDVGNLREGDYAGLSAFQNQYGFVGVTIRDGGKYILMQRARHKGDAEGIVVEEIPLAADRIYLRVDCDFVDKKDLAAFYYRLEDGEWTAIGDSLKMVYDWPHFVGYRFGLFYYSTKEVGGYVDFDFFHIQDELLSQQV